MARYTKFQHVNLKSNPKKAASPEVQMHAEADKVLSTLTDRDFVAVLDERGARYTSFDMANLLAMAGVCAVHSAGHPGVVGNRAVQGSPCAIRAPALAPMPNLSDVVSCTVPYSKAAYLFTACGCLWMRSMIGKFMPCAVSCYVHSGGCR